MSLLLRLCIFSGMESTLAKVAELVLHAGKYLHLISMHASVACATFTLKLLRRSCVESPTANV